jgi:Ca2+-binding RTX toxin-like protein
MMRRRTKLAGVAMILLVAVASALVGSAPSSGANTRTCNRRAATIIGTSGNDVLYGTNGADVIVGGGGRDQIFGLGGDDSLCGEGARDIITGGSGDDYVYGGKGDDALIGGSGDDYVNGGDGSDDIRGGSGEDYLAGDVLLPFRGDSCDGGEGDNDTALGDCETVKHVP